MVLYGSNELVPSSDLAKKFGSYLSQIKEHSVEKLAVLKNNKIEAVIISKEEYESMCEAKKQLEAQQIMSSIAQGLNDIEHGRTKPIETLWSKLTHNRCDLCSDLRG